MNSSAARGDRSSPALRPQGTILDHIGNTPLLRVEGDSQVSLWAKAEWFNPGGSVKDRPALRMIEVAEEQRRLRPGKILLDSTSGNTGIAYAMICSIKGYPVELAIPASCSEERKKALRAYGATLHFTDPLEGSDGAILFARGLYSANPERYFKPDQYSNPENWRAHYFTTGVEILEQTDGAVTHFVAGLGTSGTLMGTGRKLKEFNPAIQVVAVEPDNGFHGIEGLKHMPTSMRPAIYDAAFPDETVRVSTADAYEGARHLAARGLLVGESSGAAYVAARRVMERLSQGVVVTLFPDAGDRYFSTPLWK